MRLRHNPLQSLHHACIDDTMMPQTPFPPCVSFTNTPQPHSVVALDIRGDCLASLSEDAVRQGVVSAEGAVGDPTAPRPSLWTHTVDITDEGAITAVCDTVKGQVGPGGVSVLINNAGE